MHQMFVSHSSQNRINISVAMGEATGDRAERKRVRIPASAEGAKQARGRGGAHGCAPTTSRRSPNLLDVRRDFADNLAQAATGYLRTATVSSFLESDMTLSAKARLFSGT